MKIEIDYTDLWSEYVTKLRDRDYPGLESLILILHFPGETITISQSEEGYPLCNRPSGLRVDKELTECQ